MTQQTLNNGATLLEQRTKINANFTEVYAAILALYTKPVGGIPAIDLASSVQTSLGKADSALQLAAADARYVRTVGGVGPDGSGNVPAGGVGGATNLTYTPSPTNGLVVSDTGTDATLPAADATNAGLMLPAQVTKLAGVATGATANAADALLRDRATHTGTQTAVTISDFATAADARIANAIDDSLTSISHVRPLAAINGKILKDTADALAVTVAGKVTLVGTFATADALEAAFPAATNLHKQANVGSAAPYALYVSNGTSWTQYSVSGAGVTDGDKGDIIVSSTGTVWQVAPAPVKARLAITQADVAANAPVSISDATTLTAATHANRQLRYSGTTATLTISADATGGWANDDSIEIHTLAGSAGVPTLATPDGKSITGSATKIIGAVRKGTDVWTTGTTDPAAASAGGMPNIFDGQSLLAMPIARGTTWSAVGGNFPNAAGTATARTTSLNGYGFLQRIGYVSAATAGSAASVTQTGGNEIILAPGTDGNTPTARVRVLFCVIDSLTSCRMAAGLTVAVPSVIEPSAGVNVVYFGADSTDTQLTLMTNNGTTTTKTTLNGGTGFPANSAGVDIYEAYIEFVPGATRRVNYWIKNRVTNVIASGTVTATLPTAGVSMRPVVLRGNAANAAAVTLDVGAVATGGYAQMGSTV